MKLRYQIHSVSAMTLLGYAEHRIDRYRLNESETKRCIIRADDEQEDNTLFYQIMCVLHDGKFPQLKDGSVCKELSVEMKESRDQRNCCRWVRVLIVLAILAHGTGSADMEDILRKLPY